MTISSTHETVSTLIKQELGRRLGRDWRAGDRLPGVQELARLLGTGQRNTHRAMRELVDEGYLIARQGMGTFVVRDLDETLVQSRFGGAGTTRSTAALAAGEMRLADKTVAIMANVVSANALWHPMVETARRALGALGAKVRVEEFADRDVADLSLVDADGLLVFMHALRTQALFGERQVACVIRNGPAGGVLMPGRYDLLNADWEGGGFLAGRHVRDAGFTQVVFLARQGFTDAVLLDELSRARLTGFEQGFGSAIAPTHILRSIHYDDRSAARLLPEYLSLSPRPPAIFAASDDLALGFIVAATSHGLEVGRDYHIIGFDGQPRGREGVGFALTTVVPPYDRLARQAVEYLSTRLLNPAQPIRKIALGCTLHMGDTMRMASADTSVGESAK